MDGKPIVVVGSCMIDFVSYAPRLPKEGETIHGTEFQTNFGGKGANQCVAAAKLGAKTALVARVGDDLWGEQYIQNLKRENVDTQFVKKTANCSSGIAQITVSESGENQIVIVAGANNYLTAEDVDKANLISHAAVLVLQLETSPKVAIKALELCRGISILNGAPALNNCEPELLKLPTIFCVNESEASVFTNKPVTSKLEAEIAAKALISKGCNSVLLTLGASGVIFIDKSKMEVIHVACPKVKCLDSTGAGDAFIGALAHLLANHGSVPMRKILEAACLCASDSVTRAGTQISFPTAAILENIV